MAKITKTLQGKSLDFEKLILKNEKTRAVGNMGVNANGELINNENKSVATSTRRSSKNYRRQIGNKVRNTPVFENLQVAKEVIEQYNTVEELLESNEDDSNLIDAKINIPSIVPKKADKVVAPDRVITTPKVEIEEVSPELLEDVVMKSTGGLSGALAKAKEVKQERRKTPREEIRNTSGVKKI